MNLKISKLFFILLLLLLTNGFSQTESGQSGLAIGRLKYSGGGDWYNDPSCIPNLLAFIKNNTNIHVTIDEKKVQIMDEDLFSLPILYLTGHGRIQFSEEEIARLRQYLLNGGFLYVDDDYGMDKFFRREMKKIFPDRNLTELPISHPVFHSHFDFPNGVPKTHEHEPGPGQVFGIFHEGRMVVCYTFNTNISDGWADPNVHGDSEKIRSEALKMGVNIIVHALTQ
jgi:hypothetical protein